MGPFCFPCESFSKGLNQLLRVVPEAETLGGGGAWPSLGSGSHVTSTSSHLATPEPPTRVGSHPGRGRGRSSQEAGCGAGP